MELNLHAVHEPAPHPELAALLEQVSDLVRRYVVLGSHERTAVALWIAHSHAIGAADETPYLHVTSPEKRSGKSRLLDVLALVAARAWRAVMVSEAVLFRKIDRDAPTLLLDEVDAIFGRDAKQFEGLRGILDAGHRRGATVPRCVGEGSKMSLRDFQTFGPKALAGIGRIPDTVADRSIRIELARRRASESVERFRYREASAAAGSIHDALANWAVEAVEDLRRARPDIPTALHDRAADGWEPLLAIADAAGDEWPARARAAAVALSGSDLDEETVSTVLLSRCRDAFDAAEADRLPTQELLAALIDDETAPFGAWWGRAIDAGDVRGPASKLRRMLYPYGITPRDVRFESGVRKGYHRADFEDAWARYLPASPPVAVAERDNATSQVEGLFADGPAQGETSSDQYGRLVASSGRNNGHEPLERAVAAVIAGFGDDTKEVP